MASVLTEKERKDLFNATGIAFLFATALVTVPVSSLVLVGHHCSSEDSRWLFRLQTLQLSTFSLAHLWYNFLKDHTTKGPIFFHLFQ